ncbi:MAG: formylglycine-generating enzyme family protein [Planctomycetota bacterium]|nr:formylglycine-generating enzyme family protein [Planctomycetota bacterium]
MSSERRIACVVVLFGIFAFLSSPAEGAVIGKATVTADRAPIMSGKEEIATAQKGIVFDVTEVKGDWYGVAPYHGWIHKANVHYEPAAPAAAAPAPPAPGTPTLAPAAQAPAAPAAAPPAPAASTAAAPAEVTLDLGGGVTVKMALIPAGKFVMGEEGGRHDVTISKPFYMGVTEVTQAQYEAIMGTNPSKFTSPAYSVEHVSWDDAALFCRKLSEKTGRTVRLPTEAEWEYACRAGTKTRFSFGDSDKDLADYAWYSDNSGRKTHPVGQKKPNAWGLYDMHGNVDEMCADWYAENLPKEAVTDPQGPTSGTYRVSRGGAWGASSHYCRSAARFEGSLVTSILCDLVCGFRVVAPASTPGP